MTLIEPIPQENRYLHPDRFDIHRKDAKFYIRSSVGEDQDPQLVARALQIHGISYVDVEDYFDPSGKTADGSLVPELDGTRSTPDGKVVANYLVATRIGKTVEEASATVRLLDVGDNGTIYDLPALHYFANTFDDDVNLKLQAIVDEYGKKSIREIAALGTLGPSENRGSYELIRAMVQNCMAKEDAGQPELYIAALTDKALYPILSFIDPKSAEILGEPVQIFSEDPRSHAIRVTPVLIDLSVVIKNTVQAIHTTDDPAKRAKLEAKLEFFMDGLDPGIASNYY